MKSIIIALAMLLTIVVVSSFFGKGLLPGNARAQGEAPKVPRELDRETKLRTRLVELLTPAGVSVAEIPVQDGESYQELRIHWSSPGKADASGILESQQPGKGSLTKVLSVKRMGTLPRERSVELAPDRLLVVAVDQNQQLRWWRTMIDPRLVRAEIASANGDLRSENHFLAKTDFAVEFPDDPQIAEVRLFRAVWDGREFQLELIGSLVVERN